MPDLLTCCPGARVVPALEADDRFCWRCAGCNRHSPIYPTRDGATHAWNILIRAKRRTSPTAGEPS